MTTINNGGPAFPIPIPDNEFALASQDNPVSRGLSIRDYFAAKAMPSVYKSALQEAREGSGLFQHDDWRVGIALDAYAMADAMLRAREAK